MDTQDYAIKVENLHKEFLLSRSKSNSLKQAAIARVKGESGKDVLKALNGVSFQVQPGEFFGITGRNGSGKSTLLRILAGVYQPTSGGVHINGKLIPFIELGVGFNQDLSGRDNVFLNGSLLGFSRQEMADMYDDIVEFAELERFMDQKLKNYSSGMQVRLAFSIAIRAKGDILVLDEVLAVGDEAFKKKCYDYFETIRNDPSQTILFVTHSMGNMQKYCDRALILKEGQVFAEGDPATIAAYYNLENLPRPQNGSADQAEPAVQINTLRINGERDLVVRPDEPLTFRFKITAAESRNVHITLALRADDDTQIAEFGTHSTGEPVTIEGGEPYRGTYNLEPGQISPGAYLVDMAVYDEAGQELARKPDVARFALQSVQQEKQAQSGLQGSWEL